MRFNEFKESAEIQLTEEQQVVLDYCQGNITKEDAVSRLREAPQDSRVDKLTKQNIAKGSFNSKDSKAAGGSFFDRMGAGFRRAFSTKGPDSFIDSPEKQARQDAEATIKKQERVKMAGERRRKRFGIGPNDANAAPSLPKAKGPGTGMKSTSTPGSKVKQPGPSVTQNPAYSQTGMDDKAKVAATAANTRDYDKTLALQKKLIAQGAKIKADGLMGKNTRAAMKKLGMGAGGQKIRTDMPGGPRISNAKKKLSGPERLSRLADIPAVSKALGARGELSKDDGEFADPNAMTRRKPKKKPRTLGKQARPGVKKQPRAFGLDFMPRIDDPKGGETVNLPFGMSYKTLPQEKDDGSKG